MPHTYSDFIRRLNIRDFEKRLAIETDSVKRAILVQLLAAERGKEPAQIPIEDLPDD